LTRAIAYVGLGSNLAHPRRQLARAASREQPRTGFPRNQHRTGITQVRPESFHGRASDGHHALLVTLAANKYVAEFKFQVFDLDADNFGHPQRACVENLQHRAVAFGNCLRDLGIGGGSRAVQHRLHLFSAKSLGQHFPALGRINVERGVAFEEVVQQKKTIEMPES